MAVDADVVVVGGGLAGCTAALSAVHADPGADVALVSADNSSLHHASGLIDILGYTPDGTGPLVDPFEAFDDLPDDHPYRVVGEAAVREGMALFDDVTGGTYCGEHTDRNALVPTYGGSVKPTARYPRSVEPGLASRFDKMLLVGFEQLTSYVANLVADQLRSTGPPFTVTGIDLELPLEITEYPAATRYATALEHDEPLEDDVRMREAIADRLDTVSDYQDRIGVPAVLGWDETEEIRQGLGDDLGADVFELPMGPPSIPGQRLEALLHDALEDAGVALTTGSPVVDVEPAGDAVTGVVVDEGEERVEYRGSEFVLATGGLVGDGVETDRQGVREPLFDCHVAHPPDRYDWYEDDAFGDHRFARFGVTADSDMRPLDADGHPEYENLRAAGHVLGGFDFAAEKSGSGVSIATGYVAGRRAAE